MERAIERLWEVSEQQTGLRIDPASARTGAPGQTDAGMASNP
jgi:hypothetical protein